jgi:nucleotide-binding universal stress UspA family protein
MNAETTKTEASKAAEAAAVAEQGANVAPEQASSTKKASGKKGAPKGQKAAKGAAAKKAAKPAARKQAKPASKKASKAAAPKKEQGQAREGSKKQIILDLLSRKDGATMAEIAKATGWENHSIRGFVSGTLMKKMDLPVESFKNEAGDRTYRLAK